jgi:hypothetical protein
VFELYKKKKSSVKPKKVKKANKSRKPTGSNDYSYAAELEYRYSCSFGSLRSVLGNNW